MSFQPPASARPREVEWPPGSGRVARYGGLELKLVRDNNERARGAHRAGCPARLVGGRLELDPERCDACKLLNEIEVWHELKCSFGTDIGALLVEAEEAGEQESLL